ncbi:MULTISPECIES: hypothetical protein [unclassified Mycobacterium]|uniref:hypothetical protein n=1 Tax=unclassified Mycobacterium TaxID=2642494 RepID=UPI0029C7BD5A|nr:MULTISPECIES: hypothetical protein [unclassified Mycobacterium]
MSGKQVKLFLVDGNPGGLTVAEISNRTCKVVSAPRSNLAELVARPEAMKTGAYPVLMSVVRSDVDPPSPTCQWALRS